MFIISMAGDGSRFKKLGFNKPKYELAAKGKTLFELSVGSFAKYFKEMKFMFIYRKGNSPDFISQKCNDLGISDYELVAIDHLTSGQAETVLFGLNAANVTGPFFIFNIDTHIDMRPGDYPTEVDLLNDGWLQTFKATGEHWSFAKVNSKNEVVEVSEKKRISDFASTGLYYFKDAVKFREIYNEHAAQIKKSFGEIYVAPFYQYLLDNGGRVGHSTVAIDQVVPLGTPEEVRRYDPNFSA